MSKLNDSTLKIFKKYRLDTNMSVFGDENKLYDVVKVMDDMVGNQVSKYAGLVTYLSSTRLQSSYYWRATSSGKTTNATATFTFNKPQSQILLFDPLSLKYAGKIDETSSFIPLAKMYVNDNFVAYVVGEISTNAIFLSEDFNGFNTFKVSINSGDNISFRTFLKLSNSTYSISGDPFYLVGLFEFTTESKAKLFPKSELNIITLPDEILMLDIDKPIYCGSSDTVTILYSTSFSINTNIHLAEV